MRFLYTNYAELAITVLRHVRGLSMNLEVGKRKSQDGLELESRKRNTLHFANAGKAARAAHGILDDRMAAASEVSVSSTVRVDGFSLGKRRTINTVQ